MNHKELREFLSDHINRDDYEHDALVNGLQAHIEADEPGDTDHAAISALVEEHIIAVKASHERLLAKLDEHIAATG